MLKTQNKRSLTKGKYAFIPVYGYRKSSKIFYCLWYVRKFMSLCVQLENETRPNANEVTLSCYLLVPQ